MTSTVILLKVVLFSGGFFFCKFFRDLSTFTDTMAAEGISQRKNTYWLYVIAYWLYAGPITPKRLHIIS